MTKEDIAKKITGAEYPFKISKELRDILYGTGIVLVFGASDDLMELRGAIYDEVDCYGGGTAYLDPDKKGLLRNLCEDDECPYFKMIKENAPTIEAVWDRDEFSWVYDTQIPHATFIIMEDGDQYCRGIVFDLADVKAT